MNVETMEGRTLFSVTVSEGYPGFYEVYGTSAADSIDITVDQVAETFTLDGVTYEGVAFITVFGYDGDDTISLSASSAGYIAAVVVAGDGDDDISINFDGSIWAGNGDDTLDLADSFRGEVYGEAGADEILVHGNNQSPEINGGDGNDLIDASGNNYAVIMYGGAGNDVMYGTAYDDRIYGEGGADVLFGGAGNDIIYSGAGADYDKVDGGSGNDSLYSNGYEAIIVNVETIH